MKTRPKRPRRRVEDEEDEVEEVEEEEPGIEAKGTAETPDAERAEYEELMTLARRVYPLIRQMLAMEQERVSRR